MRRHKSLSSDLWNGDCIFPVNWVETPHCHSRAHCGPCRHDRRFREKLFESGSVAEIEFACPWGESPPSTNDGPGTRLYRILHRMGFKNTTNCQCRSLALDLNRWGKEVCCANVDVIVEKLRQSANNPQANPLRIPFFAPLAKKLVLHCCR